LAFAQALKGAAGGLPATAAAVPTMPRERPAAAPMDSSRIFIVKNFIALPPVQVICPSGLLKKSGVALLE
jgi:hypothetical protein